MQKHITLPIFALLAGLGGCALNHQLHTTAVDPDTYLILSGSPFPALLLGWSVVVALLLLLPLLKAGHCPQGLEDNLASPSPLIGMGGAWLLVGALPVAHSCLEILALQEEGFNVSLSVPLVVAAVLAVPACVGTLVLCKHLTNGTRVSYLGTMSTFPAFATLPWLLYCYQENTRNPVLSLYGYQLVGLSVAALALYLLSSMAYGTSSPRKTAYLCLVGGYLLFASLSVEQAAFFNITQTGFALLLLGVAATLLTNIYSPKGSQPIDCQKGTD